MNDGQIAVERHQNQRVDTLVGRYAPRVLVDLQRDRCLLTPTDPRDAASSRQVDRRVEHRSGRRV